MKSGDRRGVSKAAMTIALSVLILGPLTTCSSDSDTSPIRITATIAAGEEPADGFAPGDPVAGGTVRLYVDDDTIAEATLDDAGTAEVEVERGTYIVQVMAPSEGSGCFWGATLTNVQLPLATLDIDVTYICSGTG